MYFTLEYLVKPTVVFVRRFERTTQRRLVIFGKSEGGLPAAL
jgi:hypothetical protein